jgi:hypothetical protein
VKQNLKKVRKMGSKILRPIEMTKKIPNINILASARRDKKYKFWKSRVENMSLRCVHSCRKSRLLIFKEQINSGQNSNRFDIMK